MRLWDGNELQDGGRMITQDALQSVLVSRAEMMRYYDPERIESYCRSCDKYGLYWACPPFEKAPLAELGEWSHAVLVTLKTPVDPGATKEGLVEFFLSARRVLCEALREKESGDAIALVAGHCDGCSACTRPRGVACCVPSRMRYSLEALGFDVTGLAEGLAGQKVHWPAQGMPDYLLLVGALLCTHPDVATRLVF